VAGRSTERGFVMSVEMLLIAVVLAAGLITGWAKLRDQSLSEIADTMAAVDAYTFGSASLWQVGGTRWITSGAIVQPSATGTVTETWGTGNASAPAAVLTATPGIYEKRSGVVVYGGPASSTTSTSATSNERITTW